MTSSEEKPLLNRSIYTEVGGAMLSVIPEPVLSKGNAQQVSSRILYVQPKGGSLVIIATSQQRGLDVMSEVASTLLQPAEVRCLPSHSKNLTASKLGVGI